MHLRASCEELYSQVYLLKEWDESHLHEVVSATFSIDMEGKLTMAASDSYAAHLRRQGLRMTGENTFSIDTHVAPPEVVAIALGLPAHDPDFRHECAQRCHGFASAMDMFDIAMEGHHLQSGRIDTGERHSPEISLDADKLVNLDNDLVAIPSLPGFLGLKRKVRDDLTAQNILVIEGKSVIPAYVITTEARVNNAPERIALIAAYSKHSDEIPGVKSDRLLKTGALPDGRAYAIFSDSTRVSIPVVSIEHFFRGPEKTIIWVSADKVFARRGLESNPAVIKTDRDAFVSHYHVGVMKEVIEDKLGVLPNPVAYFRGANSTYANMPRVGHHASLESVSSLSGSYGSFGVRHLERAKTLARADHQGLDFLVDAVKSSIDTIVKEAGQIRQGIERQVEKALSTKDRQVESRRLYESSISF